MEVDEALLIDWVILEARKDISVDILCLKNLDFANFQMMLIGLQFWKFWPIRDQAEFIKIVNTLFLNDSSENSRNQCVLNKWLKLSIF